MNTNMRTVLYWQEFARHEHRTEPVCPLGNEDLVKKDLTEGRKHQARDDEQKSRQDAVAEGFMRADEPVSERRHHAGAPTSSFEFRPGFHHQNDTGETGFDLGVVDCPVADGRVVIVDEVTGRPQPGRRFADGLHQALEAKEGVKLQHETQTVATITLQNLFRMYHKLAGMTGTAETEAGELWQIYKLDVVVVPTNRPVRRVDHEDLIFRTKREKYNALVDEIASLHEAGLPVLVGTISVEVSELHSRMLTRKGIKHQPTGDPTFSKRPGITDHSPPIVHPCMGFKPGHLTRQAGRILDPHHPPISQNTLGPDQIPPHPKRRRMQKRQTTVQIRRIIAAKSLIPTIGCQGKTEPGRTGNQSRLFQPHPINLISSPDLQHRFPTIPPS